MKRGVEEILSSPGRKRYLTRIFVIAGIIVVGLAAIWLNRFDYRDDVMASGAKVILRYDRFSGNSCIISADPPEAAQDYTAASGSEPCIQRARKRVN